MKRGQKIVAVKDSLKADLRRHGLELEPARRKVEAVFVDKVGSWLSWAQR